MNKVDLERWQAIEDEFLNSDLDEAAFCKSRKLNPAWFRKKLREAEQRSSKSETEAENLFVELIPQPNASAATCLKVRFREVDFELTSGSSVEVFRQALQVVKEVV